MIPMTSRGRPDVGRRLAELEAGISTATRRNTARGWTNETFDALADGADLTDLLHADSRGVWLRGER